MWWGWPHQPLGFFLLLGLAALGVFRCREDSGAWASGCHPCGWGDGVGCTSHLGLFLQLGLAVLGALRVQGGFCGVGQWLPPMRVGGWGRLHQPLGFLLLLGLAVLGVLRCREDSGACASGWHPCGWWDGVGCTSHLGFSCCWAWLYWVSLGAGRILGRGPVAATHAGRGDGGEHGF